MFLLISAPKDLFIFVLNLGRLISPPFSSLLFFLPFLAILAVPAAIVKTWALAKEERPFAPKFIETD